MLQLFYLYTVLLLHGISLIEFGVGFCLFQRSAEVCIEYNVTVINDISTVKGLTGPLFGRNVFLIKEFKEIKGEKRTI